MSREEGRSGEGGGGGASNPFYPSWHEGVCGSRSEGSTNKWFNW